MLRGRGGGLSPSSPGCVCSWVAAFPSCSLTLLQCGPRAAESKLCGLTGRGRVIVNVFGQEGACSLQALSSLVFSSPCTFFVWIPGKVLLHPSPLSSDPCYRRLLLRAGPGDCPPGLSTGRKFGNGWVLAKSSWPSWCSFPSDLVTSGPLGMLLDKGGQQAEHRGGEEPFPCAGCASWRASPRG